MALTTPPKVGRGFVGGAGRVRDVLLLNKKDLVSEKQMDRLAEIMRALNPTAIVKQCEFGDAALNEVLGVAGDEGAARIGPADEHKVAAAASKGRTATTRPARTRRTCTRTTRTTTPRRRSTETRWKDVYDPTCRTRRDHAQGARAADAPRCAGDGRCTTRLARPQPRPRRTRHSPGHTHDATARLHATPRCWAPRPRCPRPRSCCGPCRPT